MIGFTVPFIVKRQLTPEAKPYWEEIDLQYRPGMNGISGLMDIAATPVDRLRKKTTPIAYDANCLEEVCGSCAMRINGRAAMACSALVDKLQHPVRLEPLLRFPMMRDLSVDRRVLFENLKRVKACAVRRHIRYGFGTASRTWNPGKTISLIALCLVLSLP